MKLAENSPEWRRALKQLAQKHSIQPRGPMLRRLLELAENPPQARDRGIAGCFESEGFRAYATYITTRSEAQEDLEKLERIARSMATAIMCCERLPQRVPWGMSQASRVCAENNYLFRFHALTRILIGKHISP